LSVTEFIEGSHDTELRWSIGGEAIMAAANVLNEGVPGDDRPSVGIGLQTAHGPQPSFQLGWSNFDPVVGVPLDAMPRSGEHLFEHLEVGRSLVSGHLDLRHDT
jgi:hypothetical protein